MFVIVITNYEAGNFLRHSGRFCLLNMLDIVMLSVSELRLQSVLATAACLNYRWWEL